MEAAEWLGELGRDLQAARSCCCFRKVTTFWATGGGEGKKASAGQISKTTRLCPTPRNAQEITGSNFLVTVAFMPPVALPAPAAQKDLWLLSKPSLASLVPPPSHAGQFPVTHTGRPGGGALRNIQAPTPQHRQGMARLTLLEDPVHIEPIGCASLVVAAAPHISAQSPGPGIAHHAGGGSADPVWGAREDGG